MIADCVLQAKWIHPVSQPPIENGIVEIRDGKIAAVGRQRTPSAEVIDLGDVALIPGLVNAHTHLEFSDLQQPLGSQGMPFTDWIKLVVDARASESKRADSKSRTIELGVRESIDAGVVAIGEIASDPLEVEDYRDMQMATIFLERLGRNPKQVTQTAARARDWLRRPGNSNSVVHALSPHAPYSVHPDLLAATIEQSRRFNCPVAMHLAESREELRLLETQSGPFVQLLESLGAWFPETYRTGTRIIDYLMHLSRAPRSLVVHGNYLCAADIDFVAQNSKTMSIVFCPRTHKFFQHEPYPLTNLLAAGINVAVGTDSRASNPDLQVFGELRTIKQKFPDLEDQTILGLGTLAGARALGIKTSLVSIEPGNDANFNVVAVADCGQLFHETAECVPLSRWRNPRAG